MSMLDRVLRIAGSILKDVVRNQSRSRSQDSDSRSGPRRGSGVSDWAEPAGSPSGSGGEQAAHTAREFTGQLPQLQYQPQPDDDADPGEVAWAWVPYEENDGRGKDRPVLVIARYNGGYLGLQATSKDHDRDRAQEERAGRYWMDIGSGDWDNQRRESEVRLDRVLAIPADAIRREGGTLDRDRFDAVARALQEHYRPGG